ncbi:MAG: hypothetical protein RSF34_12535 [Flavobacterium sp.]|uniref:hypothetical protein n=1 Tax=Flavobacterium sp. TaxID=239 RepID=UPI002FCB0741
MKILLLGSLLLFYSCTNKDSFKYVENIKEKSIGNKNLYHTIEGKLTAENDTLAYIRAYSKFKISQRLMYERNVGGSASPKELISFQIFNDQGKEITHITFKTKEYEQKKADSAALQLKVSRN